MKEKITLKKEKHCLRGEKNESDFPLINITDMPNFERKVVLITGKRKAVFIVCFKTFQMKVHCSSNPPFVDEVFKLTLHSCTMLGRV